MQSSTVRSTFSATFVESNDYGMPGTLADGIVAQWARLGKADMVSVLRQNPALLRNRSLVLNLAIEEYKLTAKNELDLEHHCNRFAEFGSSIQRSIMRQLEVQRFLDGRPDLLKDLCTPKWPEAGECLGGFHVLEELGFGSSAHVYLCLDKDLGDRRVVVKATPLPSVEASILGKLNHENIIPIYSTGFIEDRELYYLCMPYRGRSTLADLVDVGFEGGLPRKDSWISVAANRWTFDKGQVQKKTWRQLSRGFRFGTYVDAILELASQIADALDHAHQQKIVHGDLKPSNVLLTPDGKSLLLDFNLSQDFARQQQICGGTLPYMPPEQLRYVAGQAKEGEKPLLEVTSDIYSYGALLYELLTGTSHLQLSGRIDNASTTAILFLESLRRGVPPVRTYNRDVTVTFDAFLLRCLSYDASNRPATIGAVRQALASERKLLAVVRRQARVRPVLFAATVALPLAIFSGATTYIAVQPPRYLANYEAGLRLASIGKPEQAIDYFTAAAHNNPSFKPARFQLGCAHLAVGQIDFALHEFGTLAREESDPASMAYVGYCFNLRKLSVAAIPWYERAIENGIESAAVYNNLGASIIDASTTEARATQLMRSENYLLKALELSNSSFTVRLNIVRHAVTKSQLNPSYNPFVVWRHAQSIAASAPNDRFVEFHIAGWYETVLSHELTMSGIRQHPAPQFSEAELSARTQFGKIHSRVKSLSPDSLLRYVPESTRTPSPAQRYFLEPICFDSLLH